MKLFLLKDVENLTHKYHKNGGLVVAAEDLDAAKAAIALSAEGEYAGDRGRVRPVVTDAEWAEAVVYDVGDAAPAVHLFPNAGCC